MLKSIKHLINFLISVHEIYLFDQSIDLSVLYVLYEQDR